MATQTLIWTALPDGMRDGELRISALVSPRLVAAASEGDELRLWPMWVNWTERIRDATFKVAFDGGPTLDAEFDKTQLEPELWPALFRPDTFVRPHVLDDYSNRTVISYPARRVHRSIRRLYQEAGTRSPVGRPARAPLTWTTDYIDLGKTDQPSAHISAIATSGRFVYATHQPYTPAPAPPDPNRPFGRLVKIDPASQRVIAEVQVGDGPRGVAVMPDRIDPARNRIYVLNAGIGKVVDGVTVGGLSLMIVTDDGRTLERTAEIPVGAGVVDVAVSAARNHLFVTNAFAHALQIYDPATGAKLGEFKPDQPDEVNLDVIAVAVDDANDAVYVATAERVQPPAGIDRSTRVLKLVPTGAATYARAWTAKVDPMRSTPVRMAVDPERGRLYVTSKKLDRAGTEHSQVTVLDIAAGSVIAVVAIPGTHALNVAVSTHFRYCYALRAGAVSIIGPGNRIVGEIAHDIMLLYGPTAVLPQTQQVLIAGDRDGRIMIATPSTTEAPDDVDDLLPGWDVSWTSADQQAARDNLERPDVQDRDLTSRVLLFHRRPPNEEAASLPAGEQDLRKLLDFHEALSSLSDHPQVLRKLGVVVDLVVPAAGVPAGERNVRVLPSLPAATGPQPEHRSMATAVTWDASRFVARSASGGIVDGLLVLDDRFELQQLDLDGATLKLVNAAATLGRAQPGDVLRAVLPAMRSDGIALVHDQHAAALKEQFNRSKAHDRALGQEGGSVLFAEDLLRGYRLDVWDGTSKRWHSLCRRVGTYTFGTDGRAVTRAVADEGAIDISVTEAAASRPDAPKDLYAHDAVAVWHGWSMVARRPGKSAGEDGRPEDDPNAPVTPFKLRAAFQAAPGSLPTLRFGKTYRVRARAADLAGNGPSLESAPDVGVPKEPGRFVYTRFEPVASPPLLLRTPITEASTPGEALERLVLRTPNTDLEADAAPSGAVAERHVVASRSSELFAETHGVIDHDGRPDVGAYAMLARRDAGRFTVDPVSDMPVEGAPQAEVPYIPDPLSRGATLRDLPGAPAGAIGTIRDGALVYAPLTDGVMLQGSATQLGWDAGWPQSRPFRIVVRDGAGPPEWNPATRELTISLPKGEIARVPLSSFMHKDDLKLMAVWQWLREYADEQTRRMWERVDPGDPNALDRLTRQLTEAAHYALYGGHGMLTPARELVLVHAVQQPLGQPVWSGLLAQRRERENTARLAGNLQIHGKSTGSVELRARWNEAVDDPREGPPAIRPSQAVLLDIPISPPEPRHDPNRPFVTLRADRRRVARYYAAEDRLEFVERAQPEHAFTDTKHRLVRYRASATSRFGEYFPRDVPGGFQRQSDEVIVTIPSSASPDAVHLRYAVPTFDWRRSADSNVIASQRRGHGLRAYLERPWYSSGQGELLGVVIWPRSLNDADRLRLKRSISQAGADPVFESSGRVALNRASFGTEGITWGNALRLPGLKPNETVDVAGHPVGYDAERGLWYSDIAFDPNIGRNTEAYGAFVRLALVRFQPNSLPGLELSRPVTTEFMQVAADRSAIATYDPLDPATIRLVVAGQTYRATLDERERARSDGTFVQVAVEEQRSDIRNELGWRPAQATKASITADTVRSTDTVLWQGRITVPADRASGQFRIVIKEFEPWLDDTALSTQSAPRARRLVYAEILVL
ncbi:MAG TPA: YncE family protein [Solirubrobacteraceae bacterium]